MGDRGQGTGVGDTTTDRNGMGPDGPLRSPEEASPAVGVSPPACVTFLRTLWVVSGVGSADPSERRSARHSCPVRLPFARASPSHLLLD